MDNKQEEFAALANAVLQKRGYLVVAGTRPRRIGEVVGRLKMQQEVHLEHPTVVIAETTKEDLLEQFEVAKGLGWAPPRGPERGWPERWKYFYRVIAE